MLRIISLFILYVFLTGSVHAQTSTLEAKAAYLLAEESYGKGDMRSAIRYLDEATAKLGSSNAKILYLKIMALKELAAKDENFGIKLDNAIAEFERSPDVADFTEEKVLEIMKMKLERKKESNVKPADFEKRLTDYQNDIGRKLGMRIDSLKIAKPEMFEAGKYVEIPDKTNPANVTLIFQVTPDQVRALYGMSSENNKVTSIIIQMFHYRDENSSFDKTSETQKELLSEMAGALGYVPTAVKTENPADVAGNKSTTYTYTWEGQYATATLSFLQITTKENKFWSTSFFSLSQKTK